jgi:hypothetical protein
VGKILGIEDLEECLYKFSQMMNVLHAEDATKGKPDGRKRTPV